MDILLNVPYPQKDLAKTKGAKWNPAIKSWYTDDVRKLSDLKPWLGSCNVFCENLYLLKKSHTCWKCKKDIEVVLLATDKSFSEEDGYKENKNIQILTYVKKMPDRLKSYMEKFLYKPSFSRTIGETYFINHCSHCDSVQGDNFLHEVPQEAFYRKLCYKDSEPIRYAKIKNNFCIPLKAELPYYDDMASSLELMFWHMETGIESRESLNVNQKLVNKLFDCSVKEVDIEIEGL